ncbi:hypothetical protein L9F63_015467, partial [Diploptera punctata]
HCHAKSLFLKFLFLVIFISIDKSSGTHHHIVEEPTFIACLSKIWDHSAETI